MQIKVESLPAYNGDCFFITFYTETKTHCLLIDGGIPLIYPTELKKKLKELNHNTILHILLTHIDNDHIGGLLSLFKDLAFLESLNIACVYFNSSKSIREMAPNLTHVPELCVPSCDVQTSFAQSEELSALLKKSKIIVVDKLHSLSTFYLFDDVECQVLTPRLESLKKYREWIEEKAPKTTAALKSDYNENIWELKDRRFQEDSSVTNASSIALLICAGGKKMLFPGDALPSDLTTSLNELGYTKDNPISLDLYKVSHHGSRKNTSDNLLESFKCNRFLISTNGNVYGHPDKEALARIIFSQERPTLFFNYKRRINEIFHQNEIESGLFIANFAGVIEL